MTDYKIGILHPGQMGVSLAVSALIAGHDVYWVSENRSQGTRQRALEHKLQDAGDLSKLCQTCSILISVCPPHAAHDVAVSILNAGFRGIYVDANAISPTKSIQIGKTMSKIGVDYVDGGIIGGPAWEPGTCLYLCGQAAHAVTNCFSNGPLETRVIGEEIGKASALKMCYAAYTKGTTALLCAVLAASQEFAVRGELEAQWSRDWPDFVEQTHNRIKRVTAKAWRYAGEMEEISETFRQAGLPGGFHSAAAELFTRLENYKDAPAYPPLEEILAQIIIPI